MPRIRVASPFETVMAGITLKEESYLLSGKAAVEGDEYSTDRKYKAWVIPKILLDQFGERDTSEEALRASIYFDYI
jgi:hypothetical protein